MCPRIPILFALVLVVTMAHRPVSGQGLQEGCIPDSLVFQGNQRLWAPGEPLAWVDTAVWNALLASEPDNFWYIVESPRKPGYMRRINQTCAPDGQCARYVEGDLRYIAYNGGPNASQSTVRGHTFEATSFWFNGQVHWQNGRANWFKHSQRLYHSLENGEIEILPSAQPPENAEDALVIPMDTMSIFIHVNGNTKENDLPVDVYGLPHTSSYWHHLGRLNPRVTLLVSRSRPQVLSDYITFTNSGLMLVIRTSDLQFTEVSSRLARYRHSSFKISKDLRPNTWMASQGNVLRFRDAFREISEDIEVLVADAEWEPLVVPAPKSELSIFERGDPQFWGWTVAIALAGLTLFLAFTLIWTGRAQRRKLAPIVLPDGDGAALLSPVVMTLMMKRGQKLTADQFDAVVGLADIPSPETRRSRRARIIQVANAETTARFGHPLIVRTKSSTDKRVVHYGIQDFSARM